MYYSAVATERNGKLKGIWLFYPDFKVISIDNQLLTLTPYNLLVTGMN
jgi:hypothetical protein